MRWRQSFIDEVSQALQQLGLRACPVCGSAESLSITQTGHLSWNLVGIIGGLIAVLIVLTWG